MLTHPYHVLRVRLYQILRVLITACLMFLLILLIQLSIYLSFFFYDQPLHEADAIAVFSGSNARVKAGYELANKGLASYLITSPASDKQLIQYKRKYHSSPTIRIILEDRARTTFENALYVSKIIRQRQLKNIILVTHSNHMPRSYLLLRLMTLFSGIEIQTYKVPLTGPNSTPLSFTTWCKLFHNEMVEFWGSMGELAYWAAFGNTPDDDHNESGVLKFLKSVLLFQVKVSV